MGPTAPPLNHVVSVGQVLAVVIVRAVTESIQQKTTGSRGKKGKQNNGNHATTRRRIQVSLEPSIVNLRHEEPTPKFPIRGKIQGIEDNGILVSLGHGRRGFLAFSDIDNNIFQLSHFL